MAVLLATGWWAVRTFWLIAPAGPPPAVNSAVTMKYSIGKIYNVGGDVTEPIPIYKPEPAYTKEARASKLQGTDAFWIVVDTSGNVADAELLRSVDKGLDENAIETLRTWKFKPAMKKGKPVPVKVVVEVSFRLF